MEQVMNVTFNELTVRKFIKKPKTDKYKSWNTSVWVHCECSCGEEIDVPLYGVTHGYIKSCGHVRREKAMESIEKNRNSTVNAVYLTYEGKTMNISEWSKETGIPRSTIAYRISKELPIEKVLERKDDDEQNQEES
jgi:hypothetical protein